MESFDAVPEVAMFMSADVVGSAAFKTRSVVDADNSVWLEAFAAYFRELPLLLMGQVATAFAEADVVPEITVWKVLGDEMLFISRPSSLLDAQRLFVAFQQSVADYDRRIADRWQLRLRGCCWSAELGRRNRRLEIGEMSGGLHGRPYVDFLGPDIDMGFRLCAHSVQGETLVSLNLVESFAAAQEGLGLRFHHLGLQCLRGVCGDQPLPLVLVSTANDPAGNERVSTDRLALAHELAELRTRLLRDHHAVMAPPAFMSTPWSAFRPVR